MLGQHADNGCMACQMSRMSLCPCNYGARSGRPDRMRSDPGLREDGGFESIPEGHVALGTS